jgi:hypothetical protein
MIVEFCKCGCGEETKYGKKFVHGHNQKGCKNLGVVRTHLGVPRTKETCKNISMGRQGIVFSETHKKNLSLSKLGKPSPKKKPVMFYKCACGCGELCTKKYKHGHNAYGPKPDLKRNRKIGDASKKRWKDPIWAEVMLRKTLGANKIRPNKTEIFVDSLIQQVCPIDFIYSGNGKIWIDGKNPDWFNVNGKKQVIELFGDYWHGEKITGRTKEQEEELRKSHFREYGYDCLIIWEDELKDIEKLKQKILEF